MRDLERRVDRLESLTVDTGRQQYIWREPGETDQQAIERAGMSQRNNVVVIGWEQGTLPRY